MRRKALIKSTSKKYSTLFLNGLVSSLAFAPTYLFPLLFVNLFVLLKTLENSETKRESFFIGWWFGFGHFIGGTYWMCASLLVDPLRFAWLIPFAITLIPAFLACYIGLTTLCTTVVISRKNIKNKFIITTIFASFWILFEYLRGILLSGFSWNLVGSVWAFSDIMIQIASLIGIYGLGFLTIIIFSAPYIIENQKQKITPLIPHFAIIAIIFLFGLTRLQNAKNDFIPNVRVRLVQPSIEQDLKWDSQKANQNLLEQIALSKSEEFDEITHIIWSESAVPFIIQENSLLLQNLRAAFGDKTLITGALNANFNFYGEIETIYNSIYVIRNGKILDLYNKSHLVPFGEYVPLKKYLPFASKITHGSMDFSNGAGSKSLIFGDNLTFSPLICYEIIFPEKTIDYKNKPDFMINLTNDGWFGRTSGPYQHFNSAKLRAVETGIPIIRVANNGISGIIDGYGRAQKKLKLDKKGYLDSQIPKKIKLIFYKKDKFFLVISVIYISFLAIRKKEP